MHNMGIGYDELLAATKQLYEWFSLFIHPSVHLSIYLSVCHTFLTVFPSAYHHEIFRVITNARRGQNPT